MKYFDDNGNEVNIRTELDDILEEIDDILAAMTVEERLAYFKDHLYVAPLRYITTIDNTEYIVRTVFREEGQIMLYDIINRILEK